jgi:hypothetical protein
MSLVVESIYCLILPLVLNVLSFISISSVCFSNLIILFSSFLYFVHIFKFSFYLFKYNKYDDDVFCLIVVSVIVFEPLQV